MTPGIRVLAVDDNDAFRETARRHLERRGFDVVEADSAATAIDALDESIDCVVSDLDMPESDGLDLLDSVRERRPDIPFILFTGKGSEEIASDAISAGVTDYLRKDPTGDPYTLLANRIERAVSERQTAAALEESERMLSTLVSNLPGIVYRCRNEPDWPMEYIGGNVEEITGYEPDTFLEGDLEWRELLDDRDEERMWEYVQNALETRKSFEVTYRISDADGRTRWMREQGQGIFDGDGSDPVALEGFITDVTDRKRQKQELLEYDRLVDAMGDPVYTTDADGYITTFNGRAAELIGYDREAVIGDHVSTLLAPGEIERGNAVIRDLLNSDDKNTATYDITVESADGEVLDLENHVALLIDDSEFHGTIGVLRESSERPNTRLRQLHDATRELVSAADTDEIAELTNQAAKNVLDQPLASIRFRDGDLLVPTHITEEASEVLPERTPVPIGETPIGEAFAAGERRVERDLTTRNDDVDRGDIRSAAHFPLGDHGILNIASTETDAFDERDIQLVTILAANAEVALDRGVKEERLRAERDDLEALFRNIPDPTVETIMEDGKPIIERVNPAFEEVFGYESEELVGDNLDSYIVPEDATPEASGYNERIQEGEGFHGEVRRIADDGLRDFILHVVPHDVGEEMTRGYAIYTDITDQKQRERELARQNERLDQFASVVSHDLRNPLSVARGRLDLARMTEEEEHFDAIEDAHDRMEDLINGLLALARQGELTGDPIPIEVRSAAENAWQTVQTDGLAIEFDGEPVVGADPERFRQLLENLFRNSLEHGESTATVTVGALDDGFYVEDDGTGIPEGERNHVLESGYSGGNGTGFGLAIVNTIAEAHGWTVAVTESEDGGARFEFRDAPAGD